MKIKPRKNNVVIEPFSKEALKEGRIIIPLTADKEIPDMGIVYAKGPLSDLKPGQKVFFNKFASQNFEIEGKLYYICTDDEVLAVICH